MIKQNLTFLMVMFVLMFQLGCDNGVGFSSLPKSKKGDSTSQDSDQQTGQDTPQDDEVVPSEPESPVLPLPPVEPEPPREPPVEPEPPREPPVEPEPPREPPVEPEPPREPPVEPEPPREPPVEPEPPREQVSEQFYQEAVAGKVDILFLLDNSLSMRENNKKLSHKFSSLASVLEGVDWQMAFTSVDSYSDTEERGRHGKIEVLPGTHELYLTPDHDHAEELFRAAVDLKPLPQCDGRGPSSFQRRDGRIGCFTRTEEPLKSMSKAILERNKANAGFFREGADLAVVVISDEDERSNGKSKYATKPAQVLAVANEAWGEQKRFAVHGIIVEPGDKACLKENRKKDVSYYGQHVADLASATAGSTASICQSDYSKTMKDIGLSVKKELLHMSFELAYEPIPGSLRVELTPDQGISWEIQGKTLLFTEKPQEGTVIQVKYSRKK